MKIQSEDIDVESLLAARSFSVPRFQRPYSWDDENILDLWDDVMESEGEDYFIGSMVGYKISKQEFGVVDGQQRLTTLTILLCAIRDAFASLGDSDLAEGTHKFIERANRDNKHEVVLRTETSYPYFQEHIQKFGDPSFEVDELQEELRLKAAHELLIEKVNSVIESVDTDATVTASHKTAEKIKKLKDLRDSVFNLKLIFVTLGNEDDAYLIFETLNTRGKDLAVTDLAKNLFSKQLKHNSTVDSVNERWTQIIETIYNSPADLDSDRYLYHFWASRESYIPLKKLYPAMKTRIGTNNANEFLDALLADANRYRKIHEPSLWDKNHSRVASSIRAFQIFRLQQPIPGVLSIVRAHDDGLIKLGKLVDALTAIERFHFAFTAVTSSRSSGGISGMYSLFGRDVFASRNAQDVSNAVEELVSKLRDRRPPLDEFTAGFRQIVFTNNNSKQRALVRYILERFLDHEEIAYPGDRDELTIEHLAPQSLIGTGTWSDSNVGQLGNLILVRESMNGRLGEKEYSEKIRILDGNGVHFPERNRAGGDWDIERIGEATDEMARLAYNVIWKL